MKIKVQDLTKLQLNWAVATSEGHPKAIDIVGLNEPVVMCGFKQKMLHSNRERQKMLHSNRERQEWIAYQPSSNWTQGGPIIERERIELKIPEAKEFGQWIALITDASGDYIHRSGPTPLIAAMRCFVENRLGSEVEIPDILCNSYI